MSKSSSFCFSVFSIICLYLGLYFPFLFLLGSSDVTNSFSFGAGFVSKNFSPLGKRSVKRMREKSRCSVPLIGKKTKSVCAVGLLLCAVTEEDTHIRKVPQKREESISYVPLVSFSTVSSPSTKSGFLQICSNRYSVPSCKQQNVSVYRRPRIETQRTKQRTDTKRE